MLRVFIALLLTACGGGTGPECASAAQMLQAINAARAEARMCGAVPHQPAAPLVASAVLTQAAERHAQDLARTGKASHIGSDGSTVADRARSYGRPVGENVASGQQDLAQTMRELLASPGHCQNIMNPAARQFGAACQEPGPVWVQVFGV